jgi:hypothetical protein
MAIAVACRSDIVQKSPGERAFAGWRKKRNPQQMVR